MLYRVVIAKSSYYICFMVNKANNYKEQIVIN